MAQRTGAYGLVALALIALVTSGCGGSSETQATGASRPATTTSGPAGNVSSGPVATKSPERTSPQGHSAHQKQQTQRGKQPGADAGKESPQGKQGPRPVIPAGKPESAPSPKQKAEGTVADMAVSSPAIGASSALSRTYTCDGKNISPPLEWSGVPGGARELVLFVMNLAPVEGEIFFDWAVAGIDPESTRMAAGRTPPGSVVGKNSDGKVGYALCPSGSTGETYVIALYALTKAVHPKKGFDPAPLRSEAPKLSRSAGLLSATYGN